MRATFSEFKESIVTRLDEFEDHWNFMNKVDPYSYPHLLTYEQWFDKVLEYVDQNVRNN